MKKKRLFVCCGTGAATSTVIAKKIRELLETEKIPHEITQGRVSEASSYVRSFAPDVIVSSADITGDVGNTPIVSGRPFLTGIKKDAVEKEILSILK